MQVEVTRIFETPSDVLYDFLMEKIARQISEQYGVRIEPEDLTSGYSLKTRLLDDRRGPVLRLRIPQAVRGESFKLVTLLEGQKISNDYRLDADGSSTKLTIRQTVESSDFSGEKEGLKARLEKRRRIARLTAMLSSLNADLTKANRDQKR